MSSGDGLVGLVFDFDGEVFAIEAVERVLVEFEAIAAAQTMGTAMTAIHQFTGEPGFSAKFGDLVAAILGDEVVAMNDTTGGGVLPDVSFAVHFERGVKIIEVVDVDELRQRVVLGTERAHRFAGHGVIAAVHGDVAYRLVAQRFVVADRVGDDELVGAIDVLEEEVHAFTLHQARDKVPTAFFVLADV